MALNDHLVPVPGFSQILYFIKFHLNTYTLASIENKQSLASVSKKLRKIYSNVHSVNYLKLATYVHNIYICVYYSV